ncbi:MAG: RNA pseudouridine synthase [Treponema sp.]|jgi:23S rRNA pseudouridine1911/1915/1917 synthase|nr:RNA pseudouridine synthase [Treponema sp.]
MEIYERILRLDDGFAVINKLCGEAVEGAGKGMADLSRILAGALETLPAASSPRPAMKPAAVHRLDVPVSGCVLFARTPSALGFLGSAFADRRNRPVEKHYWAVTEFPAEGFPAEELFFSGAEIELVHWIAADRSRNKTLVFDGEGPGRKMAVTRYRFIGRGQNYLFLDIETLTGRSHQIRAQLARAGLHIKGDLKYGARRSEKKGGIRLHARSLSFPNPGGAGIIRVEAPPPEMDGLWEAFAGAWNSRFKPAANEQPSRREDRGEN